MKPIKSSTRKKPALEWVLLGLLCLIPLYLYLYPAPVEPLQQETIVTDSLAAPACNLSSGFYEDHITVNLKSEPAVKIYYTLDGTLPGKSSLLYSDAFTLDKKSTEPVLSLIPTSPRWKTPVGDLPLGVVLRAVTIAGNKMSEELVRTFFLGNQNLKHDDVISLVVEPEDLFGYQDGIYVLGKTYSDKDNYIKDNVNLDQPWWKYPANYIEKGTHTERNTFVEYFEKGSSRFSCPAKIRINGNATRGFAQKSLRLNFVDALKYKIFPEDTLQRFTSLILRNSGNDWNKTMFRDVLMQRLMENSALLTINYKPVIVFINGEYWGVHNLCPRTDKEFIASRYGVEGELISLLEVSEGKINGAKKSTVKEFDELVSFLRNNDPAQDSIYSIIRSRIDVASFSDMIISNVYFCNSDWPNNNVKFWKYSGPISGKACCDGKWRWILYDTDWGFGYTGNNAVDMDLLAKLNQTSTVGVIFERLMVNKDFRRMFDDRFSGFLKTRFQPAAVIAKIDSLERIYKPLMQSHIDRWRVISSIKSWEDNVQDLRIFADKRSGIQKIQLDAFLSKGNKK